MELAAALEPRRPCPANHTSESAVTSAPTTTPLCDVDIALEDGAPIVLGRSPWRNRRVSYIAGGRFDGERLKGKVRPGGGDWSEVGADAAGAALTLLDVRSIWVTHDGAQLYVHYGGRLVIPADG